MIPARAALDGFHDDTGHQDHVYYPVDGVSPMQKLQMVTQEGKNVEVVASAAILDDVYGSAVKGIFTDEDPARSARQGRHDAVPANSINWGRLAPQIAYHCLRTAIWLPQASLHRATRSTSAYRRANFGNILAAYIAKKMGLPVNKFICASNRNNVLTDFKKGGESTATAISSPPRRRRWTSWISSNL